MVFQTERISWTKAWMYDLPKVTDQNMDASAASQPCVLSALHAVSLHPAQSTQPTKK